MQYNLQQVVKSQSKRTIKCGQIQTLLSPPNQMYKCLQLKESVEHRKIATFPLVHNSVVEPY